LGFHGAFGYKGASFTKHSFLSLNLGYHGAPFANFSILAMEFRLSRSLFSNFSFTFELQLSQSLFTNFSCSRWNFGYHVAFSRTFVFHDGISAITKPFHKLFFFHDGTSAITEPFHKLFFFTLELQLSQSLFTNFSFSRWNFARHIIWGKTHFIYITKSVYIGSALLKALC
jgi:hypothetical protein